MASGEGYDEEGGAGAGPGSDTTAIHDNVPAEISPLPSVTAAAGDHVLIEDATDGNNKKRVDASDFLGGIGGTIAATQVAFGDGADSIAGEAAFSYDSATNTLSVDTVNVAFGSADAPSVSTDTDQGMFRQGPGALGLAASGVEVQRLKSTGIVLQQNGSAATPNPGYQGDGNTGPFLNGNNSNEYIISTGGLNNLSVKNNGGTLETGFNGAAPVAKPTITGSRAGNVALASLLTAGATMGLWTDSTTA